MRKRGVLGSIAYGLIIALFSLISIYGAYADHTASVSITPLQIYETNSGIFDLSIANTNANSLLPFDILFDDSKGSINSISIAYTNFTLLASTIPSDWTRSLANDVLAYTTNYSALSSGASILVRVQANANKVDANTTAVWTITTEDLENETSVNTVQLSIINDDTAPLMSGPMPNDGIYIKQGTNNQQANITASDPETGVKQVNFNYDDCAYLNDTKNIVLANDSPSYSGIVDLSSYADSTQVCFSFNAENFGGEMGTYPGRLTIDGIAPIVTLISPSDGKLMNSQSDFEFIASDNLAPDMDCELLVDGNVETTVTALNNATTTISVANVSEGAHSWAVRCTDLAGWQTTSSSRNYVLDRTAPSARIQSLVSFIIAAGTQLDFIVTDNFELDGISYTFSNLSTDNPNYEYMNFTLNKTMYTTKNESHFSIPTEIWEEGYHDIYVWSDDAAGNNITGTFLVAVDKTAPNITLVSPTNESNVDANFTFDVMDNYDSMLDCTLYVNGQANGTGQVNTSQSSTYLITSTLGPANYTWRIECIDDAGNNGISEEWNVTIIDTIGPSIAFNDVGTVVRGNSIIINATITDISGVDENTVYATMEDANNVTVNVTLAKETGTDNYIGAYPTNSSFPLGQYIARVFAEDNFANSNSYYAVYNLTYAYVVTLILNPNPAQTGQQVTASGTVAYDSGEIANDGFIILILPNTSIDAVMENGGFSHEFNAPDIAALYDIIATITPGNGFTFSAIGTLNVTNETQVGNTTTITITTIGSNNKGTGGTSTSNFGCGVNKAPDNNGRCVDITTQNPPSTTVSVPSSSNAPANSNSGVVTFGYCGDGTCDQNENCNKCVSDCNICPPNNDENITGIGLGAHATGFFNISAVSSSILWLILVLTIMAFALLYVYQYGAPQMPNMPNVSMPKVNIPKNLFRRKDRLGIDRYMENRKRP